MLIYLISSHSSSIRLGTICSFTIAAPKKQVAVLLQEWLLGTQIGEARAASSCVIW